MYEYTIYDGNNRVTSRQFKRHSDALLWLDETLEFLEKEMPNYLWHFDYSYIPPRGIASFGKH